jgi:hypothetical protein
MAKTAAELGIKATKLDDNGWYDGYNYDAATNTFGDVRGQAWSQNNPAARGSMISDEVNAQSAAAQGKTTQEFNTYLKGSNNTPAAKAAAAAKQTTSGGGGGSSLGSGTGVSGGAASSSFNVTETYDKLYQDLGIDALKSDVAAKQAEITARRERLAEAQGTINENPWYAEATRTGKLRRLEEQAQADIENIAREQALLQAQVDEANQQLATKTNLSTQQYQIDRQSAADSVAELNTLLQSGADMSNINVGDFAARTGMSTETISALVAASQAQEIKPSVIQSTDDSGMVTVTVIDQNTGAIVGQTSLGRIGNAQNSGGSKASESEISRYYMDNLRGDVASGSGVRQIFQLYSGYLDPNQIIQIYNASSPNGPAKESAEELAALGVTSYYGNE